MNYREFFRRFGGSARTKNIGTQSWWPFRTHRDDNKPFVRLPETSGLPKEFIRLCPWEIEFLFAVARRAEVGILEIGRFNGGSTFMLACANSKVPIFSIDIAPQNDTLLGQMFERHNAGKNVSLIVGDSRARHDRIGAVDVIFFDGDHSYSGCSADIETWYDSVVPGGLLVFHDSYLNEDYGVQDAILDLIAEKGESVEVVVSPLIGASYWRYPQGSMACVRKKRR